jgi:phosphosulfolactate synthase (CoM biosynthesis protein A)
MFVMNIVDRQKLSLNLFWFVVPIGVTVNLSGVPSEQLVPLVDLLLESIGL